MKKWKKTEEKLKELSSILEKNKKELYTLELKIKEIDIKKERVREDMERLKEEEEKLKADMAEAIMKRENYQKMLKEEEKSLKHKKEEYQKVEEKLRKIRQEREEVLKEMSMIRGRLQSLPPEDLPFEDIRGVYGHYPFLFHKLVPQSL